MPSSSFIVNSEFLPMSYQELLHPVITQTQYQRELDEKYTQLDLQADKLEQLANSAVDRASYERYKSFANRLREEASNLSKYGLRGRDNARFMELFRNYGKEIQPLLDALLKRERLIAMQQLLSLQDPTSLYDRSAGNISLEELMRNPSAAPIRQSGELLRQQSAAMALNLTNEIKSAVFSKTKTPGYLAFTLKYGISSDEVAAFVANPNSPQGNKVLRAIYDLVMTSSGVKQNWEGDAYNRASQYVAMGLWSAIGKQAVQPLSDVWGLQQNQQAWQSGEKAKDRAHQASEAAKNRAFQAQQQAKLIAAQRASQKSSQAFQRSMADRRFRQLKELMGLQQQMAGQITGNVPIRAVANMNKKLQMLSDKELKVLKDNKFVMETRDGRIIPTKLGMMAGYAYKYGNNNGNYLKSTSITDTQRNRIKNSDPYGRSQMTKSAIEANKLMYKYMQAADPTFDIGSKGKYKYNTNLGLSTNKNIGEFNSAFNKYITNKQTGFDTYRSTNYAVTMGASEGKHLLRTLTSTRNKYDVYDENGKVVSKSVGDLRGNNVTTSGTITVDTDKRKAYLDVAIGDENYQIPITKEAVGASAYNNVMSIADELKLYGTAYKKGLKVDYDKNTGVLKGVTNLKYNFDNIEDQHLNNLHQGYINDLVQNMGIKMLNWNTRGKTKGLSVEYLPQGPNYYNVTGGSSLPSFGGFDDSDFDISDIEDLEDLM